MKPVGLNTPLYPPNHCGEVSSVPARLLRPDRFIRRFSRPKKSVSDRPTSHTVEQRGRRDVSIGRQWRFMSCDRRHGTSMISSNSTVFTVDTLGDDRYVDISRQQAVHRGDPVFPSRDSAETKVWSSKGPIVDMIVIFMRAIVAIDDVRVTSPLPPCPSSCTPWSPLAPRASHLANPIASYAIQSYPILSNPIPCYPILSYPMLSYPLSPLRSTGFPRT